METFSHDPFVLHYEDELVGNPSAGTGYSDLSRLAATNGTTWPNATLRTAVGNVVPELLDVQLEFDFSMSSLNFDINQEVLTANSQFTADLSFEASILGKITLDGVAYTPAEFNKLLARNWRAASMAGPGITDEVYINSLRTVIPANLRALFESFIFRKWETTGFESNMRLQYHPHDEEPTGVLPPNPLSGPTFDGQLSTSLAVKKSSDLSKWQVSIRFVQSPTIGTGPNPTVTPIPAGLFFPRLLFLEDTLTLLQPEDGSEEELDFDNTVISIGHEVLILPEPVDDTTAAVNNVSNAIGKVANDISETILNIGSNIANNLAGTFRTQLQPVGSPITSDIALWIKIKKGTDDLGFDKFQQYMDAIFCGDTRTVPQAIANKVRGANGFVSDLHARRHLPFPAVDAYRSVKVAAEAFVMVNCMVDDGIFDNKQLEDLRNKVPLVNGIPDTSALDSYWVDYRKDTDGMLPYLAVIRQKLGDEGIKTSTFQNAFNTYATSRTQEFEVGQCYGIIEQKLMEPCLLELIWSYWMEESMMVQGLKAILRRFQNIRAPGARDPLANLLIDPLRPLSNLIWGYGEDEQHRLTVMRRGYEYNSHYGISTHGSALKNMRFADSRSKFMEAFHTLLNLTSKFYRQADDMTVRPDGFPILNALKETHLILSEGAHNQYGDLPFTARTEMLMEQWLLSRSEFREFLPTRIMVAYPEPWMDRVSALNQLMGWTNTSVLHFRDLARFGEQILLSVRFGNWANITDRNAAANWAQFWREQIQGYIHGYRAVSGVDLTADILAGKRIDAQQPSVHLRRLLAEQQTRSGSNGFSSNGQGARKKALADVDEI